MKLSYYNFIVPDENDGAVLFNSRSGCMAQLDPEHYKAFRAFENCGQVPEDKEFQESLLACGFTVDDNENELDSIRLRLFRSRFSAEILSLVIAPTLDCNFRCVYCYEKDQLCHQLMDQETQKSIICFVEERIDHIRHLNIQWYGGEPLLAQDTIRNLSEAFLNLCGEHHVEYSADIITNGSLLDEKAIDLLNTCNVTQVQVTLDGSRDTHDSRRPLKGGGGSFDAILHSLRLCKEHYKGAIALRMNVDRNNLSEVDQLTAVLEENNLDNYVALYLGQVSNINETCESGSCLKTCEFAQKNLSFLLSLKDGGNRFRANCPEPKGNFCGADYDMAYIIGPDGSLYKCHMEIGCPDEIIGNINNYHQPINPDTLYRYLLFDPTPDPTCATCKYLPLCLGGCPAMRHNGIQDCTTAKQYVQLYMERPSLFDV